MAQGPIARSAQRVLAAGGRAIQRSLPSANVPSPDQRAGSYKTITRTYLTQPFGQADVLYSADIPWTRVRLLLETAGPVAVSTAQQFLPVLSGKGILLQTGVEVVLEVAEGNRLYIASTSVNRVRFVTEPIPWAEQILGGVVRGLSGIANILQAGFARGGK